jgi:hypothetical protein
VQFVQCAAALNFPKGSLVIEQPDVIAVLRELHRLDWSGIPHSPTSREGRAIERALQRCAAMPETAALATQAREAIAAAQRKAAKVAA